MVTVNYERLMMFMLVFEHNVLILEQKLGVNHCVPGGFDRNNF